MMDQMDVDLTPSSSSGSLSVSSSSEILDTKGLDLVALNDHMKTCGEKGYWRARFAKYSDTPNGMKCLILEVLTDLLEKLEARNHFINKSDTSAMLERLDDDGLKEWKDRVWECVRTNDWRALIVHRAYIWISTSG
jgi:hypothetical protein